MLYVRLGGEILPVSRHFVVKNHITTVEWKGPAVCDGTLLNLTEPCHGKFTVLGLQFESICGVLHLDFDARLVSTSSVRRLFSSILETLACASPTLTGRYHGHF